MQKPSAIYDSYPWIYIAGGASAISLSQSTLITFSGILLMVSGIAILLLRRQAARLEEIAQSS